MQSKAKQKMIFFLSKFSLLCVIVCIYKLFCFKAFFARCKRIHTHDQDMRYMVGKNWQSRLQLDLSKPHLFYFQQEIHACKVILRKKWKTVTLRLTFILSIRTHTPNEFLTSF